MYIPVSLTLRRFPTVRFLHLRAVCVQEPHLGFHGLIDYRVRMHHNTVPKPDYHDVIRNKFVARVQ